MGGVLVSTWMTLEEMPRKLTVKGRSAIDPDVLVAYLDGDAAPYWIVDNGSIDRCYVCGLDVRASKVV